MQRYFAQSKIGDEFTLYEQDYHHIKNVMRFKIGDTIEVIYEENVYICRIDNLEPLKLNISDTINENNELKIDLTVAVSLVNEQKFDLIIQKLTELGVSTIIPIETTRSIIKLDDKKMTKKITRWQMICKEASEQSKRTRIPKVMNIIPLKELKNSTSDLKLLCSLNDLSQPLDKYLNTKISSIIFAIGPEGGFTENEEKYLLANEFKPISLGKRVMRVETAAIYVASVINYIYKGWCLWSLLVISIKT